MATAQMGTVLRHVRQLAGGAAPERTDRQLLDDFAARRDEAAFAALVGRHGPMVFRVCRRVLGHEQDAEDAFQATFLVLAGGAATVRRREALAGWLHGVAHRTAMKARRTAARRRAREGQSRPPAPPAPPGLLWEEVRTVLDEEVGRLAEPFRSAFALCVLEGRTGPEAAAVLGCKEATVYTRMNRARRLLRKALAARGIELAALLGALAVADGAARSAPAALVRSVVRFGPLVAAGEPAAAAIPTHVAALAAGVTRAMFLSKAKIATAALVAAGLLVAVSGALAYRALAAGEAETPPVAARPSEPPAPQAGATPPAPRAGEANASVTFSGRVFDPDGRPVAGARVVFHQRRPNTELPDFFPVPTMGATDVGGRFRFSGRVHFNAPIRDYPPMLTLTAHVPDFGPAAVETSSPDGLKGRTLRLVKDDVPIRGRILNLEGRPIAGVTVRPIAVVANAAGDLGRLIETIETGKDIWADLPNDFRPNIVIPAAAAGLTHTAKTDTEGKFTLSGFGRERIVVLRLDGPAIETCLLNAMTRKGPTVRATRPRPGGGGFPMPPKRLHEPAATYVYAHGNPFDFAPGPATVVEGTVRDQDTGKPIAGVVVRHGLGHDFGYSFGWAQEELTTTTDMDGDYRLAGLSRPAPQAYQVIRFIPPRHQPYLPAGLSPPAPEFGKPVKVDVHLKRGVWVKGRVADKATGRPVQALVEYFAFADNPDLRGVKGLSSSQVVSSTKDGSFALAVLRGRGIVAVKTDEMRRGTYLRGQGADAISGLRDERLDRFVTRPYLCVSWQFDTLIGIEPDANAESVACDVQLDPGKTVKGTILDPDGKPLAGASIRGPFLSLKSVPDLPSAEFAIPAVNPNKHEAYFFEHRKRNLAAAVILKGDEAAGFTVKLKPTATIAGRLVTKEGEPVRDSFISGRLEAGQLNMTRPWNGFFFGRTGADGRFKVEGLLAGVKLGEHSNLFTNLTLQPGEVRDLGDIPVKNVPD